ncbi:glycosyltransferase family 4 protein [Sphingobacterium corticibacterium]|uniref:Glycosyltransferase family 1 protein n=1 Tax=Sphingobacterium corticibacterium TaxID=2484746 RepID=A0A4Q6XRM4_9SPHI|nr:glycosyltransferase family 4 protein [Sphingobacterium corticibacterium]RZF58886.1 glycosyltransferase family 1 protein [Sphingobacterium corticibacterium]
MKKKIIVISSLTMSLVNFRLDLLRNLVEDGYDVLALGPDTDERSIEILKNIDVRFRTFVLERTGFNPIRDIKTIRHLKRIYKEEKPNFILPYTVKPVIYGNFAKIGTQIKSLNWITGLGFYGLESRNWKDRISKIIMTYLYRLSFSKNDIIVFQNNDDVEFFKEKGILKQNRYRITPGSGINLEKFTSSVPDTSLVKFIFVGRLIEAKGIRLFIRAAEILKDQFPDVEFIVIGGLDEGNPNAIQKEEIDILMQKGIVAYLGHVDNVIEHVRDSSVFVLPSMYREGVPRSILEALSSGRAIITTDNVGCRETVLKDYNGVLIPRNSIEDLISAMTFFCNNRNKIIEYGENSRKLAEDKFDVSIVNRIMLNSLKAL